MKKILTLTEILEDLDSRIESNKLSKDFILMKNYISTAKYTNKILINQYGIKNLEVRIMKSKTQIGMYDGLRIFINEDIYFNETSSNLLKSARNICHEITHVFSDFKEISLRSNIKMENVFDERKKPKIKNYYAKLGIGLYNAMKLMPKGHKFKLLVIKSSSIGNIYFDKFQREEDLINKLKDCFSIADKEETNYFEELISYSLCGSSPNKKGILKAGILNRVALNLNETLTDKLNQFLILINFKNLKNKEENKEQITEKIILSDIDRYYLIKVISNTIKDYLTLYDDLFINKYGKEDEDLLQKIKKEFLDCYLTCEDYIIKNKGENFLEDNTKIDYEGEMESVYFRELKLDEIKNNI